MDPSSILWEKTVQPGASWSHVRKRGAVLPITGLPGGANLGALFSNFERPVERRHMAGALVSPGRHMVALRPGTSV